MVVAPIATGASPWADRHLRCKLGAYDWSMGRMSRGSNQDSRPVSAVGAPDYWWLKARVVRLSHQKRAFILTAVLAVAALTFVTVAVVAAHNGGVDQPALRCWPTITAAPTVVHAGESVRISSNGFQCGDLPKHGVPGEYWIQAESRTGRVLSANVRSEPNGAFAVTAQVSPDTKPGQYGVYVSGHPEFSVPLDGKHHDTPALSPIITVV